MDLLDTPKDLVDTWLSTIWPQLLIRGASQWWSSHWLLPHDGQVWVFTAWFPRGYPVREPELYPPDWETWQIEGPYLRIQTVEGEEEAD